MRGTSTVNASPPSRLGQEPVGDLVPVCLAHHVDAIEIHEQQDDILVGALGEGDLLRHAILEQHAVGQTGERIVVRQVVQPRLRILERGSVLQQREIAARAAIRVADARYHQPRLTLLAVGMTIPDLAGPFAGVAKTLPHPIEESLRVMSRTQHARRLGHDRRCVESGVPGERGVHREDAPVRIDEHHRVGGRRKDRIGNRVLRRAGAARFLFLDAQEPAQRSGLARMRDHARHDPHITGTRGPQCASPAKCIGLTRRADPFEQ
jgi:hypothetical protein